jgi:hypothetical protein
MTSKKDFTQVAFAVFQQAVGEAEPVKAPSPKQEAGRKGGLKGGAKRMESMTPEQRKELALKAAGARWTKKAPAPQETAGGRKR